MSENLPNETEYRHLAEFLCSGGRLEIGASWEMGSFARLYVERTVLNVVKMEYDDLAEVLRVMENQARQYIEENW